MTIIEILEAIGVENIQFQPLDEAIDHVDVRLSKGTCHITFGTTEQVDMGTGHFEKAGFVLWVPRDRLDAAMPKASKPTVN